MQQRTMRLCDWGGVLVTRKLGERVRQEIASQLHGGNEPESIILDCSGLQIMDYSCADELVARLAIEMQNRLYGDRFLLLDSLDATIHENIEVALKQRSIAVQCLIQQGRPVLQLLGELRPYLESALTMLNERRELTARDLADSEGLAINTASNRLTELAKNGLAYRRSDSVATGGKQFQYLSIQP